MLLSILDPDMVRVLGDPKAEILFFKTSEKRHFAVCRNVTKVPRSGPETVSSQSIILVTCAKA